MIRLESRQSTVYPVTMHHEVSDTGVDGEVLTAVGNHGVEQSWPVPATAGTLHRALVGYALRASVKVQEIFGATGERVAN